MHRQIMRAGSPCHIESMSLRGRVYFGTVPQGYLGEFTAILSSPMKALIQDTLHPFQDILYLQGREGVVNGREPVYHLIFS